MLCFPLNSWAQIDRREFPLSVKHDVFTLLFCMQKFTKLYFARAVSLFFFFAPVVVCLSYII